MSLRRVLAVIPAPTFGGSSNQVLRLHGPLLSRGWELVAAVPEEPGNAGERLEAGGVEVHRTPMHRLRATADPRSHLALARHTWPEISRLRRLVRQTAASVVQNHGDLNPQAGIAGHLEGAAVHWHLLDTRTPPALRHLTMPLATRLADSMSTVGRALAETHPGVLGLGERCVVLYPPVDATAFANAKEPEHRAAARAELGVPAGAVCLGAIGNRNPQKGFDGLVRAAAAVRERLPGVVVRILGAASPGHEAHEVALRAAAARLGMDGEAFRIVDPGGRVPELIGAFDVLALSSVPRSEGLPTVILEAMAAGIAVVATDVGAVSEAVADGETGFVVPALDDAAIADALGRLAGDAPLREAFGAAGRARVHERFGLERLTDLYDRAYTLAVEHRSGRRRRTALVSASVRPAGRH